MKIAVTGGSGFIGSYLVKELAKNPSFNVVNIDIEKPEREVEGVETIVADLTDLKQTLEVLKDVNVVYHIAGAVLFGVRRDPHKGVKTNVNITSNILEACRTYKIKIIFASSFYVYDGLSDKMVVNEETPLDILNMELFGSTKALCEAMIRDYTRKYGIQHVILRFGSAFGAHKKCTNVIKDFIESARKGEPILIWGEGRRKNQYTYVKDIVVGCVQALNSTNKTYNLISNEQVSTGDLARHLQRKYNFDLQFDTTKTEGASQPYMLSNKAMEELGWRPTRLEEAIEEVIKEMEI